MRKDRRNGNGNGNGKEKIQEIGSRKQTHMVESLRLAKKKKKKSKNVKYEVDFVTNHGGFHLRHTHRSSPIFNVTHGKYQ